MELSVMMPCYEEAENLKLLIPQIIGVLTKIEGESELLIVDTEEPKDETEQVCADNISDFANIRYVSRRNGNDYGDAIRTGIEDAKGKYLIIMDADGSHNPEDIGRLYRKVKEIHADVVIGSRYMKGGNTDNPRILIWMSNILNISYRLIFRLNVKDVSDSYRIYVAEKIKKINLVCNNFDIVEEILIKLKKKYPSVKIVEIPITFSKRQHGESKRDLIKFVFSYIKTICRLRKLQNEEE